MNKKYAVKIIGGTGDIGAICYKGFDFNGTWFDNKEDAEEFKSMLEYVNKGSSYKVISREKESKIAPVEPVSEHRHPHADMIIEWAKDTSNVVECYDGYNWIVCDEPTWSANIQYRFQPAKPERVFPVTSLTEDELVSIYFDAPVLSSKESYKYIADAAIKQYILDTEKADDKA